MTDEWIPIKEIPAWVKDEGIPILAYGGHTHLLSDEQRSLSSDDHWWDVIVWSEGSRRKQWMGAIYGDPVWSKPTHFKLLTIPKNKE